MRLLRSTAVVGAMTMGSRVLGFVRDILLAAALGAGPVADAFVVALRIPNLFRRWFAEGAFNAAFVPLYSRRMEEEGGGAADDFASDVLSVLIVTLGVLVVGSQLAMPWLMRLMAPGFLDDPDKFGLTVLFTQITMPYLLLMSLTAMVGGALNARDKFAAAAGAPILLNVVLISLLYWAPLDQALTGRNISIGVTASGVLQALMLFWAARRAGVKLKLGFPKLTPGVKRLIVLGVPGAVAAGVTQINITISQIVASFQDGAVSLLYYADRLYQLPLGVIGIAMGVALLPMLTKRIRANDTQGAANAMNRAVEISMALTLPAAAALAVMPNFLAEGLFMRAEFTIEHARGVAYAVLAFALGLPAFVMIKVLSPSYFAREDTATPMRFAGISMIINVVLGVGAFWLVRQYWPNLGHVGLAAATSVAGWVNALLLLRGVVASGGLIIDERLKSRGPRILVSAVGMAVVVGYGAQYSDVLTELAFGSRLLALLVLTGIGGITYCALALVTGALKPSEIRQALKRS
ncbi:MAG: murein biosynthesis integral membrane protein MurJ [Maricaulis sp.]|jgi:putative peptidoglycan lipid II flippase|nr:murein biosynthesis integral membrane protein MurJ [Maricaulis sp.]